MIILGIGGILNDAASAILVDGRLVAAVEESKLVRRGRAQAGRLPEESIAMCLELAGVRPDQVDCVAVVRPIPAAQESGLHLNLRARFPQSRMALIDHHRAHAASAFYASAFDEATVLVLDRHGDFRCGSRWRAADGQLLRLEKELYSPDSLGEVYGRVTELLGFNANADEHKVQWLAAAGEDGYRDVFLEILQSAGNDWPRLDRSYFDAERTTHGGFSGKFFERIGLEDRAAIPERERARLAAGLQRAIETTVLAMAGGGENLCLAGGLAMNALLVQTLESSDKFSGVFAQPAGGNSGTALGAVFEAWHGLYREKQRISLGNLCWGPSYSPEQTKQVLENCKLRFRYLLTAGELIDTAVEQLSENKIVAWMHGRMEFGPRALGNRSILASPHDPYSAENLNTYIKHRESFRKFAASVPAELAGEYFDVGPNARYLATVGRVRERYRKCFQSAVLAGDLIRVHAVSEEDNPLYWKLLHAAGKKTGLPVLYNTSFNLFGEPLVCTPRDAVRSFYSSGIDAMFVGNFFLQK
jgi:carbamoyltransferase